MRSLVLTIAGVMALAAGLQAGDAGNGKDGRLILDESAYFRYYIEFGRDRFDSASLKTEGAKLLGDKGLERLEKKVKRYFAPPFAENAKDWNASDWRDEPLYFISQVTNVESNDEQTWVRIGTPPPPTNWMAPDFDDTVWFRQRTPLLTGNFYYQRSVFIHGDSYMQQSAVRRAFFRATFEVEDLETAGDYILSLVFRGGARVFINGQELGRAFLPPGELTVQTAAEPYPAEAYLCLEGERPEKSRANLIARIGADYCLELSGQFEDAHLALAEINQKSRDPAFRPAEIYGIGDASINRQGWDRITRLRNRTLGPLSVPKNLLKKGPNILAVELRVSDMHPLMGRFERSVYWPHCWLLGLALRGTSPRAAPGNERPARVQVWVEDIHRPCFSADFGPGSSTGVARIVGGLNGTYAAQIAVGTSKELTGLKVTPGELKGEQGGVLPASALQVSYMPAHPATEIVKLGQGRNFPDFRKDPLCSPAEMALLRFGPPAAHAGRLPREKRLEEIQKMQFFDHIAPGIPEKIPAGACQPFWLSMQIPADAAPGTYRGSVTVEAQGLAPLQIPLVAEVYPWRVPDAHDFQTIMALEQSPYGVAKQYNVSLWSDDHFKLMEASFRELARVGNKWLFVPIAANSEFGNKLDSVIPWTKKKDGTWTFDYSRLDRYLKLAVQHLGTPRVICFTVMLGGDDFGGLNSTKVEYVDEASGQKQFLNLSSDADPEPWKAFATSLYAHMQSLGLDRAMFWGYGWDSNGDPGLIPLLAKYTPSVKWARGAHGLGNTGADETFPAASRVYGVQLPAVSAMGWKNKFLYLLLPRSGSSIVSSNGHSPPFVFRLMTDRALVSGLRGIGRLGADYWDDSFFDGMRVPGYAVGMPCTQLFWPGKSGAESSARFEVLREGLQEAEIRIFLEQALDRNVLPEDLAARVKNVLYEHNRETLYLSVGTVSVQAQEYSSGWQERSRRLYKAAAEAAAACGLDMDRLKFEAEVPARAKMPLALKLRNWTAAPKSWKAKSDTDWLVLEKTEGKLGGHETLKVFIDSNKLKPGETAAGKLTIADAASGDSFTAEVAAKVGGVFDFVVGEAYDFLGTPGHASSWNPKRIDDHAVFNVTVGGSEAKEFTLANLTGSDLPWKITSPVPWIAAAPASGTLKPQERAFVKITSKPADKAAATLETLLAVSELNGPAAQKVKFVTFVIPPYLPPAGLPPGTAVPLNTLNNKETVTFHKSRRYWFGMSNKGRDEYGPVFEKNGSIMAGVPQITTYNIDGRGFTGFSAQALVSPEYTKNAESRKDALHMRRISFEIHVDGQIRAQSGLMKSGDEARLLVVNDLKGAKELRLVIRFDTPEAKNLPGGAEGGIPATEWIQPAFYK